MIGSSGEPKQVCIVNRPVISRQQKLWRCRSANLEQSAVWPANTKTSATNILKHYWRHICLTRPRRFVTVYTSALEILLLTYLLKMSNDRPMGSFPDPKARRKLMVSICYVALTLQYTLCSYVLVDEHVIFMGAFTHTSVMHVWYVNVVWVRHCTVAAIVSLLSK